MRDVAGVKILCAGCLEWFPPRDLRVNDGHPYCAHCYPAIRIVRADTGMQEKAVKADLMGRKRR